MGNWLSGCPDGEEEEDDDDDVAGEDEEDEEECEPLAAAPGGLIRCPFCGLVRPATWFDESVVAEHELERCVRTALGGRRGFQLEGGYGLSAQDVVAMEACAIIVLRRLQELAEQIGADVLEFDDDIVEDEEDASDR